MGKKIESKKRTDYACQQIAISSSKNTLIDHQYCSIPREN